MGRFSHLHFADPEHLSLDVIKECVGILLKYYKLVEVLKVFSAFKYLEYL